MAVDEPRIKEFYDEQKETNSDQLNAMFARFAENGSTETKPSSKILFLMIELTFPLIAKDKNLASNLRISLTTYGLQSLKMFSKYIPAEELNNQLNHYNKSPLYLALSQYYKDELAELIGKYLEDIDTKNLCSLAIDSLTRDGWLSGIGTLSSKIAPVQYKPLVTEISNIVAKQESTISTEFKSKLYFRTVSLSVLTFSLQM
jgi:hypothetical protein